MNVFQQNGYVDREEYLVSLVLRYNMDYEKIKQIASFYLDEDCFTSLILTIEDLIDMRAWREEVMRERGFGNNSN